MPIMIPLVCVVIGLALGTWVTFAVLSGIKLVLQLQYTQQNGELTQNNIEAFMSWMGQQEKLINVQRMALLRLNWIVGGVGGFLISSVIMALLK